MSASPSNAHGQGLHTHIPRFSQTAEEVLLEKLDLRGPCRIVHLDDQGAPIEFQGTNMGRHPVTHEVAPSTEHGDRGSPFASA